jgi:hypothetical protein
MAYWLWVRAGEEAAYRTGIARRERAAALAGEE